MLQWAVGQDAAPLATMAPEGEVSDDVVDVQVARENDVNADEAGVQRAEAYEHTPEVDSPYDSENEPVGSTDESTGTSKDSLTTENDPSRIAYPETRRNARTMSLTVPAPRGLITDRNGEVMATTIVAYQPAIRQALR